MDNHRAHLSPDLAESATKHQQYNDSALEGVASTVKLLLKLVEDHKQACHKKKNDPRRMLRVAGIMTVLENVRTRIQQCQSFENKRSVIELRRCKSDLRSSHIPRDKRLIEHVTDEKERQRSELNTSLAARKSLERTCSSLGKEKEIMAGELAKKVHELNEMVDIISDLRSQNETLLEKVKEYASEHRDKSGEGENSQGNAVLQDRNKQLSEQLLRSLDGYRSMKRRIKGAQEENAVMRGGMEEMGTNLRAILGCIRASKEQNAAGNEQMVDIEAEISELEQMFALFNLKVPKNGQKKG